MKNRKIFLFFILIVLTFFIFKFFNVQEYLTQENVQKIINNKGVFAPLIFIIIYSIASVFFIPGIPFALLAGATFGPLLGIIYADIGATIGASLSFLIARYFLKDWVYNKVKNTDFEKFYTEVEKKGWKIVAITRLIPLFPYNFLNYFFGITKIKFSHYFFSTLIFMIPGCIGYVIFGSSFYHLLEGRISFEFIIGLLLIGITMFLPKFYKRIK